MGKSSSCPSTHPTLTNAPPPLRESKILADSEAATVPSLIWKELCQTSAALFLAVACWDLDCGCKPAGSSKRRGGGLGGIHPGTWPDDASIRASPDNESENDSTERLPLLAHFLFLCLVKKKEKEKRVHITRMVQNGVVAQCRSSSFHMQRRSCARLYAQRILSLSAANWFDSETGLFIQGKMGEGVANYTPSPHSYLLLLGLK